MTIHLSRNRTRHLGIRRVRYCVVDGWSNALVLYLYFVAVAVVYGPTTRTVYSG